MTIHRSDHWFTIRRSGIHGRGAYALCQIRKGARIAEYTGERISHEEAEARYDEDAMKYPMTYLFTVDKKVVIDATRDHHPAKYINHSCDPNCETVDEDGRIFIEAMRTIYPGEEITYDYHLECDGEYGENWERRYACQCGAWNCRGTLLPPPKKAAKKRPKRPAERRSTRKRRS